MKYALSSLLLAAALTLPSFAAEAQTSASNEATGTASFDSTASMTDMGGGLEFTRPPITTDTQSVLSESNIRDIQQSLNQGGYYNGSVDGVWGDGTVAALRQFQLDNGLDSSGAIDNETLNTLGVQLSAADSQRIEATGGILANEPIGSGATGGNTADTTGASVGVMNTPGASTMSTPGTSTMGTPGASTMGGLDSNTSVGGSVSE